MSIGRIPELLLATLLMGGLVMLLIWVNASEQKARSILLEEAGYVQRLGVRGAGFMEPFFQEKALGLGSGLPTRIRNLYPKYAGRVRLMRFRFDMVIRIFWVRPDGRLSLPPIGFVLLPIFAEALRQRAVKQSGVIFFPNELIFNIGVWLMSFGTLDLVIGYLLSPVVFPPALFLLLLIVVMTLGLTALIAHIPGRFNDDK